MIYADFEEGALESIGVEWIRSRREWSSLHWHRVAPVREPGSEEAHWTDLLTSWDWLPLRGRRRRRKLSHSKLDKIAILHCWLICGAEIRFEDRHSLEQRLFNCPSPYI